MDEKTNYKGIERELLINEMDRQISQMELETAKMNFAEEMSNSTVEYAKPVRRKLPFKMRFKKWCSEFHNKMVKTLG